MNHRQKEKYEVREWTLGIPGKKLPTTQKCGNDVQKWQDSCKMTVGVTRHFIEGKYEQHPWTHQDQEGPGAYTPYCALKQKTWLNYSFVPFQDANLRDRLGNKQTTSHRIQVLATKTSSQPQWFCRFRYRVQRVLLPSISFYFTNSLQKYKLILSFVKTVKVDLPSPPKSIPI